MKLYLFRINADISDKMPMNFLSGFCLKYFLYVEGLPHIINSIYFLFAINMVAKIKIFS
jgi:hypothetical protein